MAKPIYIVGGSKGGVGKSLVSMSLTDYLVRSDESVLLIESDTSNPDVWKCYKSEVSCVLINLDEADGWIELVNVCEQNSDMTIVVNTAARNNTSVSNYGAMLNSSLGELKRELVTFWVINRQRDSIELLKQYMSVMRGTVHVLTNGYFGEQKKFELYNSSKAKEEVEARDGKSLHFPELADRVADDIYSKRLSINAASKELPIGNRAELLRWRGEVGKVFSEVIP